MNVASSLGFEEESSPAIDFSTNPEVVRAVAEGFRLGYGHLFNPAFSTEFSLIDPLPHQRIAVYDHMLPQPRLHFLLADEPGGGKTIMAGLYIREMLARRLIRRILVVPPAGLIGNWERELRTLFSLDFHIIGGADSKADNPFRGPNSDRRIVSVDTLAGERTFARLQEQGVEPYDLCIFDEAHKLSADRQPDFSIRRTDRYRVAEALAGVPGGDPRWSLDWSSHHVLLLTATPYMGKDFPRARILNRSAARLAMSIFQRRLTSSTYAMMRSFERRLEKLKGLIESIQTGKITVDQLTQMQRKLDETKDVLDEETGDEESPKAGKEENELTEHKAMGGVVAVSLTELIAERKRVEQLLELAKRVDAKGDESKFQKLRAVLEDPDGRDEKLIIFTEHRDTLDYLVRRLEGLGFTGQVAQIHGGMEFRQREEQIEFFRKETEAGSALYLVCTDAAGEGINLQFAWRLVNWDIPWNPARLEQRMGRIHRCKPFGVRDARL